ncbi:uncharacterized protein [Medicago truncatula]|uniref:uncharacterized protein n=1 Tax=Medicago truncatula TaxID=3880 RepID=UPI0019677076|nr:uncharacterized protein LOC120578425 [Medicago truncatula]
MNIFRCCPYFGATLDKVDRTGRGGGLALFWHHTSSCNLVDFSNNHITVEIIDSVLGPWRLTCYYGYPNGGRRIPAWNFLRQLANQFTGPWCIFGDFNDILDASEKRGRNNIPQWLINGFRQAVIDSASVETLVEPASDHYPILTRRNFRYKNAWHLEPGFKDMVTNSWQVYSHNSLIPKMSSCAEEMSVWSKAHCNKLKSEIEDCRWQLQTMRTHTSREEQVQMFELRKRMQRLLAQDDAFWRQHAKTHWYRDGDRNTKFFHASATARKQKHGSAFSLVIDVIPVSIFAHDNEKLTAPFTKAKFREAIFSMHLDKCPGPDRFNPGFYKHFWNLCSVDIFKECCVWLDTGQFPPDLSMTNIALIPKGNSQVSMKDWRPIALCNALYKIISKVLALILKGVLSQCISDSQSAFVPGRSILDNAMVAIEVIHFMKTKTRSDDRYIALKLDINKAYDRMDWDYLCAVMVKMGFNARWIQWMSMCVESVDYSVLVNNEKVGPIIPGCGLRQWDPLSPYLFIICVEGLSSLIRDAEARGVITDDCFLFFEADEGQAIVIKNILSLYEAASGQEVLGTGKYLALPSMVGRDCNATFSYIKYRVWKKINSWSSNCLSKAVREVVIKSVLQAIPLYVMSIFQLPATLIDTIEKMMNSFWWGHGRTTQRGINWMRWEKLSVPEVHGGMVFKDLSAFNLAMLVIIDEDFVPTTKEGAVKAKSAWSTDEKAQVLLYSKARVFLSCALTMEESERVDECTNAKEAKDLKSMNLEDLIGSLRAHEVVLQGDKPVKKVKTLALKASQSSSSVADDDVQESQELEEVHEEEAEDELALISKRIQRMMLRRNQIRKKFPNTNMSTKTEADKSQVTCFGCNKTGHYKSECPDIKKVQRKPPFKKKA